jgi:hypothetical protein
MVAVFVIDCPIAIPSPISHATSGQVGQQSMRAVVLAWHRQNCAIGAADSGMGW